MKNCISILAFVFVFALNINAQSLQSYYPKNSSSSSSSSEVTSVQGYVKSNGAYVSGYTKTYPNHTMRDNYSSTNNYNPYTGKTGYRANDYTPQAYNYGRGKLIQTGSSGGQYYINKNGNKTYVPKR